MLVIHFQIFLGVLLKLPNDFEYIVHSDLDPYFDFFILFPIIYLYYRYQQDINNLNEFKIYTYIYKIISG